jgi:uncharacterized protein
MRRPRKRLPISVSQDKPLVIWRFCDGKRGHENQTQGLLEALQRRVPVIAYDFNLRITGGPAPGGATPGLLLGAGHRTHGALWRAQRRNHARSVILMKPSLGRKRFDLCVVPEHDGLEAQAGVLLTRGVLNRVRPPKTKTPGTSLIAVGGPSRHHDWLGAEIVAQVKAIIAASESGQKWNLTNSRRTPEPTWQALKALASEQVTCLDWRQLDSGWLVSTLEQSETAWVSEDSVSMIYEALSAGAGVGLLSVPRRNAGRVVKGVTLLISDRSITTFGCWQSGAMLRPMTPALDESARVACWIENQWLKIA